MGVLAILSRPVLKLNKGWVPISTTTVEEAIGLVAKGSAVIVDPSDFGVHTLETWNDVSKAQAKYEGEYIRSTQLKLMVPEVIRLNSYEGQGQRSVVFSRKNVFKRDKFTCQYCGKQPGTEELTIDHVVPRSKGGTSTWENSVLACVDCNKKKADLPLSKCGLKLRKVPKKPSWKALAQVAPGMKKQSWEQFLSKAYWEVELEP